MALFHSRTVRLLQDAHVGPDLVNKSGSIRCEVPDEQMGMIIGAIILPDSWMDRLLAKIQLADEIKRVNRERRKVETRLKKLGQVYLDDDNMDHEDCNSERRS